MSRKIFHRNQQNIETAYREMAAEEERDGDAHGWSEGMIGDVWQTDMKPYLPDRW